MVMLKKRRMCVSPVSSSATSLDVLIDRYSAMFDKKRYAITAAHRSDRTPPSLVASVRSRGTLR